MPSYKHIFFDLDHTLWDFDRNAKSALADLYKNGLGKRVKADFDDFYQKYLYHNAQLWARYEKGFIGVEELKWRRMWRTLMDFKIGDEVLAKEISADFLDILPTKKEVFPYTFEILDYLLRKKYVLHLITNGFEKTQRTKLTNSGLDKYFTEMITSEASNSLKPKKEIFEFAMQRAGTTVKECIMIGDNQSADIEGAMNTGMDAVFMNHINEPLRIKPTYVITHLKELEGIL